MCRDYRLQKSKNDDPANTWRPIPGNKRLVSNQNLLAGILTGSIDVLLLQVPQIDAYSTTRHQRVPFPHPYAEEILTNLASSRRYSSTLYMVGSKFYRRHKLEHDCAVVGASRFGSEEHVIQRKAIRLNLRQGRLRLASRYEHSQISSQHRRSHQLEHIEGDMPNS